MTCKRLRRVIKDLTGVSNVQNIHTNFLRVWVFFFCLSVSYVGLIFVIYFTKIISFFMCVSTAFHYSIHCNTLLVIHVIIYTYRYYSYPHLFNYI